MSFLNVKELQAREKAAWASPVQRALYSTRHIPGFPWHTVTTPASTGSSETPTAVVVRRHVIPYDYPFTVFVKGRWVGRRLLEVYAEELPHHTPTYYEACLRTGRLYCLQRGALGRHNTQRRLLKRASAPTTTEKDSALCGANASDNALDMLNVVLQHGDVVYHTVHRHEVPVIVGSSGVDPVYITAVCISRYGLLCVSKPTGLPTHATGRYMLNSLTALLEYVLAPKRLRAWLVDEDPLMQSLVSTQHLSVAEKKELYDYYAVPHSTNKESASVSVGADHHEEVDEEEIDPDKAPRPCHRLDKVTSGVLLLAVHQDAAKRIGTALMHKAREVDAAVTAELATGGSDTVASTMEDTPVGAPSLQSIIGATYDLQKYYLARVVGTFCGVWKKKREASSADAAAAARNSHCVWPLSGSENCLQTHNRSVQGMLASTSGVVRDVDAVASTEEEPEDVSAGSFPGGVLITAPVAAVSAATLCQVLRTITTTTNLPHTTSFPSCSEDAALTLPAESMVLCTPYTGRLHQIRYHLSQLDCPIVGDVVYTPSASGEKSRTDGADDAHVPDEGRADLSHTWKRNDSDYLYFDPAQLPAAYRDLCELAKHETEGKETVAAHARVTLGMKRDRVEEEHDDSLFVTSAAWQEEPPCYECAGRLPLVATKECATGTSAVCLHAWAYEIKESMLLQPQQVRQTSPLSHCEDGTGSSESGTVVSMAADVGGLRVVGGGFVRFEAPLPLWASSS